MRILLNIKLIALFLLAMLANNVFAADTLSSANNNAKIVKYSAEARKPSGFVLPNDKPKLSFDFKNQGELSAWINQNGEWHIEGWVKHQHLRCATYSLGLRFGIGTPSCINVEWLGDIEYISNKKQCNNAVLNHSGYERTPSLSSIFDKITCAQAVIKCEGVCN